MGKSKLSQATIEKLGYYVYLLIDPREGAEDNGVFYVGKGTQKRALAHLLEKDFEKEERAKHKRIREICEGKKEPKIDILRHGLTSDEAFKIERAVIDYIGIEHLTNQVLGHDPTDTGRMSLEEVEIKYQAKKAEFKDDVLLININKTFRRGMTPDEILKKTQGNWKINKKKAENFKIVCAVFHGIIREVFEIEGNWVKIKEGKDKGRGYFVGKRAAENIRERYLHTSVYEYWPKGMQSPIRYSDNIS